MAVSQVPPSSPTTHRRRLLARRLTTALGVLASVVVPAALPAGAATTSTTTTTTTPPHPTTVPAYWLVASDGGIFSFGGMPFYGSMGGQHLNQPMVGMAPTPDSKGYWTDAADGGIFSFGDAAFHGSVPGAIGRAPDHPVVGMAVDQATGGYWMVASDGGIFAFGAPFFGSMGGRPLAKPIVAMAATPDAKGYWLVASDGGIFAFGDANFFGSTGNIQLAKPIVGASSTSDGKGYWLVASDGGIFAFGDAGFYGSLGGQPLVHPIAAMTTADQGGYWLTDDNGAVTSFGDAGYYGSAPQVLNAPVVGIADGPGTGAAAGNAYQSGSYGYDVSNFQCGQTLPSGHAVGVVETVGAPFGKLASCFAQELTWAGAGLNLYVFMAYGTQATGEPGCTTQACNYGYATALDAYTKAQGAGANVNVTWWLDVEGPGTYWSSDTTGNENVVQGAVAALRAKGINNVGIYSTSYQWAQIVGTWKPQYPQWVAGATSASDATSWCTETYRDNSASNGTVSFDGGAVWLVQYPTTSNGDNEDGDYAC